MTQLIRTSLLALVLAVSACATEGFEGDDESTLDESSISESSSELSSPVSHECYYSQNSCGAAGLCFYECEDVYCDGGICRNVNTIGCYQCAPPPPPPGGGHDRPPHGPQPM